MNKSQLFEQAKAVLEKNDAGTSTRPAPGMYPHQWLWDSAFIAIGIAHYDPQRAAQEIYSLLDGQWSNGMIPHMIFADGTTTGGRNHNIGATFWQSHKSPYAPPHRQTSGITQPPMVAESCLRIAQQMKHEEARAFLQTVFPKLVAYHLWLYTDRDPDRNGIVALFHPWETGLDNTPGWMEELSALNTPVWIQLIERLKLDVVIEKLFRNDIKKVKSDERISTANALRLTHVAWGMRHNNYDTKAILRNGKFAIESLSFNAILIGNNAALVQIADLINIEIPKDLLEHIDRAKHGLESLWNPSTNEYGHRNYRTGEILKVHGISKLLPLYSGAISKEYAAELVRLLTDEDAFWLEYPIPTVPRNSPMYRSRNYWQGPTWVNTNWLIIDGLLKYGYVEEADYVRKKTLLLFEGAGSYEYFSAISGEGLGSSDFSWTAALIIDLIKS